MLLRGLNFEKPSTNHCRLGESFQFRSAHGLLLYYFRRVALTFEYDKAWLPLRERADHIAGCERRLKAGQHTDRLARSDDSWRRDQPYQRRLRVCSGIDGRGLIGGSAKLKNPRGDTATQGYFKGTEIQLIKYWSIVSKGLSCSPRQNTACGISFRRLIGWSNA